MQTIGVLGGVGPQATMDFEARVHRISQQLVPQRGHMGYPPLVVYYHRAPAFIATEVGTPELPLRPHPDLLLAAARIGALADFLVITSNLTHVFRERIEEAAGCEVLSMIEAVLAEVRGRGWARIGVLGFGDPIVYTEPLGALGLTVETISGDLQTALNAAILELMEGREDAQAIAAAEAAIGELQERGVDGIVLGCTEIPLLLGAAADAENLINPLELLAQAAVRHALA